MPRKHVYTRNKQRRRNAARVRKVPRSEIRLRRPIR